MSELEIAFNNVLDERKAFLVRETKAVPELRLTMSQMTETFIMRKLAEYELRLRNLENSIR